MDNIQNAREIIAKATSIVVLTGAGVSAESGVPTFRGGFIEEAGVGEVGLTTNEYKTAARLKEDYWLYVVFSCGTDSPALQIVQDPARLERIEHHTLARKPFDRP